MNVTIGCDADEPVTVEISDDQSYVPEVLDDVLRRACERALWIYRELHPVDVD